MRIIVGGTGTEKTPSLAGRFADEFNVTSGSGNPLEPRVERMRETARAAGRNPEEITVSVMGPALVADSQSSLDRLLADAAAFRSTTVPDLMERWRQAQVPFGTMGEVTDTFGRLAESGVEKYYMQWLHLTDHEGIQPLLDLAEDL